MAYLSGIDPCGRQQALSLAVAADLASASGKDRTRPKVQIVPLSEMYWGKPRPYIGKGCLKLYN
jgi:hypothetical protein